MAVRIYSKAYNTGWHARYNGERRGLMQTTRGRRHYAYAMLSADEDALVRAVVRREGISMSNFVRRCINSYLLEEGDSGLLLQENEHWKPRKNGALETLHQAVVRRREGA